MLTAIGFHHRADWRDGAVPKTEGATHIVSHDTRHRAYDVPADQVEEFIEWLAYVLSGDNDPMFDVDFRGTVRDYLEEIDVTVREVE